MTGVVEVDGITKSGDETIAEQKGEFKQIFSLEFFSLWGWVCGKAKMKAKV